VSFESHATEIVEMIAYQNVTCLTLLPWGAHTASTLTHQHSSLIITMVQERANSPRNATDKEKKMLQIRGDLQGLLYKQDWSAMEGMIRGVLYADRDLCISTILWKNQWQSEQQTLLHDMLIMPESDPPMTLLHIVIDTAPQVLYIENVHGHLPLHVAIYSTPHKTRSLEIIRHLVKADPQRRSLSPIAFWQSIRRGDVDIAKFLLTFQECAKALIIKVNGRIPLYYASKTQEETITPFLRLLLQATSDEMNQTSCCLYQTVENCAPYMDNADFILDILSREKEYCTNHLIDVARRRDTRAAILQRKRQESAATKHVVQTTSSFKNASVEKVSAEESEASATTKDCEAAAAAKESETSASSRKQQDKEETTEEDSVVEEDSFVSAEDSESDAQEAAAAKENVEAAEDGTSDDNTSTARAIRAMML